MRLQRRPRSRDLRTGLKNARRISRSNSLLKMTSIAVTAEIRDLPAFQSGGSEPRPGLLVASILAGSWRPSPPKFESSGETVIEKPCIVTQRRTRTPIAPILASDSPSPVQMPMRPGSRLATTPFRVDASAAQAHLARFSADAFRARVGNLLEWLAARKLLPDGRCS